MHSYLHKIFILVKSGCYIESANAGSASDAQSSVAEPASPPAATTSSTSSV
jgi:hypothetical protein